RRTVTHLHDWISCEYCAERGGQRPPRSAAPVAKASGRLGSVAAQVFGNAVPVATDVGGDEGDADGAVVAREGGGSETFQVGDVAGDGVLDEFAGRTAGDVVGIGGKVAEGGGAGVVGDGGGDLGAAVGKGAEGLEFHTGDGLDAIVGVVGAREIGRA